MCLDRITRKVVLKKNLKVKKIVGTEFNNHDKYYHGCILYTNMIDVEVGINVADTNRKIYCDGDRNNKCYDSGFHCYPHKTKDEVIFFQFYHSQRKILEFDIPKGTEVVYGKQNEMTVIVTPILIYNKEV